MRALAVCPAVKPKLPMLAGTSDLTVLVIVSRAPIDQVVIAGTSAGALDP
jgi:hypothetical protein